MDEAKPETEKVCDRIGDTDRVGRCGACLGNHNYDNSAFLAIRSPKHSENKQARQQFQVWLVSS
jgi:hypothetical protein